jgi:hypothetical protein
MSFAWLSKEYFYGKNPVLILLVVGDFDNHRNSSHLLIILRREGYRKGSPQCILA